MRFHFSSRLLEFLLFRVVGSIYWVAAPSRSRRARFRTTKRWLIEVWWDVNFKDVVKRLAKEASCVWLCGKRSSMTCLFTTYGRCFFLISALFLSDTFSWFLFSPPITFPCFLLPPVVNSGVDDGVSAATSSWWQEVSWKMVFCCWAERSEETEGACQCWWLSILRMIWATWRKSLREFAVWLEEFNSCLFTT